MFPLLTKNFPFNKKTFPFIDISIFQKQSWDRYTTQSRDASHRILDGRLKRGWFCAPPGCAKFSTECSVAVMVVVADYRRHKYS